MWDTWWHAAWISSASLNSNLGGVRLLKDYTKPGLHIKKDKKMTTIFAILCSCRALAAPHQPPGHKRGPECSELIPPEQSSNEKN